MTKQKTSQHEGWEIKDRNYYLTGSKTPLTLTLPSKHTRKHPLLYFDEESGSQKELRYATNQASLFVDEQKGESTMGHITFKDGSLFVEKRFQAFDQDVKKWKDYDYVIVNKNLDNCYKQIEKIITSHKNHFTVNPQITL